MVARCGPQLRSPSGGYLVEATKARESAAVLIIGAMMPSAPKSSARLAVAKSPSGTRTTGAAPPCRMAAIALTVAAMSHRPCCISTVTAAKPSRAITSATSGEARPHQPEWTVSPAPSRRASEKDFASVMFANAFLYGSPARLDLGDRPGRQLVDGAANLVVGQAHALGIEILADFAEDVVAASFHIRDHDLLGIGFRSRAGEPELLRRPQAKELVAARRRLELQLLVMGKLLLEAFLTLVERGHAILVILPRELASSISCASPCIMGVHGQGNIAAWRFLRHAA